MIFKTLVDGVAASIESFKDDPNRICGFLGIDTSNGYLGSWVTEKFTANIKRALQPDKGMKELSYQQFSDIEDALVYDAVLNETDNSIYLLIIRTIRDHQKSYKAFDYPTDWAIAIENAKNYNLFSPSIYSEHGNLRDAYPRAFDVGTAAKELRDLGCRVELEDTTLEVKEGMEKLAADLETVVSELGGIMVIKSLIKTLERDHCYFEKLNRFLIISQISFDPRTTQPMIPYGYLLNLAIKYPYENPAFIQSGKRQEAIDKLKYLAFVSTLFSTVLDIRPYGIWERFFQSGETLPKFVSEIAMFDAAISFPSTDINEVPSQLEGFFSWIDSALFESQFNFCVADFINVAKAIIAISKDQNGPVVIYQSSVQKLNKTIQEEKIHTVLLSMSHIKKVNENFKFLTDYTECDFGFKPLIKVTDTKYLLADRSWCAGAFYEVMADLARRFDKKKGEGNIGIAIEKFTNAILKEKGIRLYSGNYAGINKGQGECDVLIESQKAIMLMEIKKKVLTRKSKSGVDTGIIVDLAGSLLDAQLQAGRTELILRRQGYIELEDGSGNIYRIELKGRNVERIAMTHLDFGSFQDRNIINNILSIMVNTRVELIDKTNTELFKKFETIKVKSDEWAMQAEELKKNDPDFDHYPFFNCWFLSLSQLTLILQQATDNDSFYERLRKVKHVTLSSSNFYYEFYMHSGMAAGK